MFRPRGLVAVKGKGRMETFFLCKSLKRTIFEIVDRPRGERSD